MLSCESCLIYQGVSRRSEVDNNLSSSPVRRPRACGRRTNAGELGSEQFGQLSSHSSHLGRCRQRSIKLHAGRFLLAELPKRDHALTARAVDGRKLSNSHLNSLKQPLQKSPQKQLYWSSLSSLEISPGSGKATGGCTARESTANNLGPRLYCGDHRDAVSGAATTKQQRPTQTQRLPAQVGPFITVKYHPLSRDKVLASVFKVSTSSGAADPSRPAGNRASSASRNS